MPRFHQLEVTGLRQETDFAVELTLAPLSGDFAFEPGQYLTFRKEIDGVELRRCYSVCSTPAEGLKVGIKAVNGGAFSSFANSALKPGDILEAMEPMGRFGATRAENNLAIAGGSGITPLLSIIKTTLEADENARFTLIYANRSLASTMFRAALQDLKDRYLQRFQVIHILEDNAQDIALFSGRLDKEKLDALFARWIDIQSIGRAFICGPAPMMAVVKAGLSAHLTPQQIVVEHFASDQPGRAPKPAAAIGRLENTLAQKAKVKLDGVSHSLDIQPQSSVLDAALEAELDAPFACRAGVCSTCKARLVEGSVEMRANQALEDYEVDQGYILTCQSYPTSAKIVVDYDG